MKLTDAAAQLESFLVKSLLTSSGAFKGDGGVSGSPLVHGLFADALADAVAKSGGLGLAPMLARSLEGQGGAAQVTSGFGMRVDPFTGEARHHDGVDLSAPEGTPFGAAADGVVVSAGPRGGYGNAVELVHPDGSRTLYAHAQSLDVVEGQAVRAGQVLGLVGQTGRSTGPHLHLELRSSTGVPVDPQHVLKAYRLRADD